MINYNFWKKWKRKTEIEKKAIKSVELAKNFVIKSIPKNKLAAIYIKGSFARREMKKGSDVDMVPIVTENKYEGAVFGINNPKIDPVAVVPLSLWELKNNKLCTKSNYHPDLRAKPDRLLKKLNECKLIYGKPLNPREFTVTEDKDALKEEMEKIKKGYIPAYETGKIKFSPLLKEVFWLVELEQTAKGKKVKHSFGGIERSVKDKNHLIHDASKFRKIPLKNKKEEKRFVLKLKKYLVELEKLI